MSRLVDPKHKRRDFRLAAWALKNDFPITQKDRKEIIDEALDSIRRGDPRLRAAARAALIAMDTNNIRRMEVVLEAERMLAEAEKPAQQIGVAVGVQVVVKHDGNFYGNADRLGARSIVAPDAGASVGG